MASPRSDTKESIEVDPAVVRPPAPPRAQRHWRAQLATGDPDYASAGYDTSTASLASSIHATVLENGRRYPTCFGADRSLLPAAEAGQDRPDLQHEALPRRAGAAAHPRPRHRHRPLGAHPAAPGAAQLPAPRRRPRARPPRSTLCTRATSPGASATGRAVHAAAKPGGYVQLADLGCAPCRAPALPTARAAVVRCDDGAMAAGDGIAVFAATLGRPGPTGADLVARLAAAGSVDVVLSEFKQPIGPWPRDPGLKRVGAMMLLDVQTGFHAYGLAAFTRILGLSSEAAEKLCNDAVSAARNKNFHTYNLS